MTELYSLFSRHGGHRSATGAWWRPAGSPCLILEVVVLRAEVVLPIPAPWRLPKLGIQPHVAEAVACIIHDNIMNIRLTLTERGNGKCDAVTDIGRCKRYKQMVELMDEQAIARLDNWKHDAWIEKPRHGSLAWHHACKVDGSCTSCLALPDAYGLR